MYPTLEDKAAHLLYFLVKDHPFVDGCKRIAATLFLEFLNKNKRLVKNGKLNGIRRHIDAQRARRRFRDRDHVGDVLRRVPACSP